VNLCLNSCYLRRSERGLRRDSDAIHQLLQVRHRCEHASKALMRVIHLTQDDALDLRHAGGAELRHLRHVRRGRRHLGELLADLLKPFVNGCERREVLDIGADDAGGEFLDERCDVRQLRRLRR
jgi:hypothetical protein